MEKSEKEKLDSEILELAKKLIKKANENPDDIKTMRFEYGGVLGDKLVKFSIQFEC